MARHAAHSAAEATAPVAADTGAGAQQAEASGSKGEGRAGGPAAQGSSRRSRTAQSSKHSKRNDAVSKVNAAGLTLAVRRVPLLIRIASRPESSPTLWQHGCRMPRSRSAKGGQGRASPRSSTSTPPASGSRLSRGPDALGQALTLCSAWTEDRRPSRPT